jgi:tagatose 6-phosphate kinase
VLRPIELAALAGGKGVNAARAAARLGGSVMTTGIAGGHAGRWIVESLAVEGLDPHFAFAAAESRTTYVTVDRTGDSVVVYESPSPATETEFAGFLRLLEDELLPACARAIVAGSIPAGVAVGGYAAIVEACHRARRPILVDASRAGLHAALAARPDIVKVGRIEVVEAGLVGSQAPALDAARALVERGAVLGIVTDGHREVAAAEARRSWRVAVPRVEAVNAVGSGDAFNAALSLALLDDQSLEVALARGVAAGTANALVLSGGMLDVGVARQLEHEIVVEQVDEEDT